MKGPPTAPRGRAAVKREAVGSNPTRGHNLKFFNQLDVARAFGLPPNALESFFTLPSLWSGTERF